MIVKLVFQSIVSWHWVKFGQKLDIPPTGPHTPAQELDVNMFSVLVYPLRSKGKDGHSAAAHIVSG